MEIFGTARVSTDGQTLNAHVAALETACERVQDRLVRKSAPFLLPAPFRKAYPFPMTKLLDRAVEAARSLPPDTQDEIARLVLQLAGDEEPPIALTAEERAAIASSKEAAARGEFATDEQMRAAWAKHGL
jgi:hypothetical protein